MINLVKPDEVRACGSCEICCTVMGVKEIEKEPMKACNNLLKIVTGDNSVCGCSIYETKPECCTEFKCLWLHGAVGEFEDRPDKLGVMFDWIRDAETIQKHGNILIAYETIEGALSTERIKYWLHKMSMRFPIVLNYLDGKKSISGLKEVLDKIIKVTNGTVSIH